MERLAQRFKSRAPLFARAAFRQGHLSFRILTHELRLLPDFIIIGTQRGGTTSLYSYLVEHPAIAAAWVKEVQYFSAYFGKGMAWYRAHFPLALRGQRVTGEATTNYMIHPLAPPRIARTLPQVKLIALLRNPVDRAYSHYLTMVKAGLEPLSFEGALEREPARLRGEAERMVRDENYWSCAYDNYSYLLRGAYVDQLRRWRSLFPREQFLIRRSEDLYSNPARVVGHVLEFLNVPNQELERYPKYDPHNLGPYPKMNSTTRKRLLDYFAPHNRRLSELLDMNFDWDQ